MSGEPARLRVVFLPMDPVGENPYQRQLADHLEPLGVDVLPAGTSAAILGKARGEWRADVVHLHWLHPLVLSTSALASSVVTRAFAAQLRALRRSGVGIVWTAHNLANHEGLQPRADRLVRERVLEIAHRVIAHDAAARTALEQTFGPAVGDKIAIVPHGHYRDWYAKDVTRADARRRLGLPDSSTVFAFVGHMKPYKGVPDLIAAFRQLGDADAHLVIAGRPSDDEQVATLRQAIGDDARVIFEPRFVPDDELQVFLNASDVVVFPYRSVLTSGAALLASSFGRPAVAPRLADLPLTLGEDSAFLYDPAAPSGLSDALRAAHSARADLAARGRLALAKMSEREWPDVARATLAVYREALEAR